MYGPRVHLDEAFRSHRIVNDPDDDDHSPQRHGRAGAGAHAGGSWLRIQRRLGPGCDPIQSLKAAWNG